MNPGVADEIDFKPRGLLHAFRPTCIEDPDVLLSSSSEAWLRPRDSSCAHVFAMEMTWRHFVDPNGEFDELDVAKDALSRISSVAADVGARQKLPVAGCLAAKLCIAKKTLDSADAGQLLRVQRRLPKLIEDLERVCTVFLILTTQLPETHADDTYRLTVSPVGRPPRSQEICPSICCAAQIVPIVSRCRGPCKDRYGRFFAWAFFHQRSILQEARPVLQGCHGSWL